VYGSDANVPILVALPGLRDGYFRPIPGQAFHLWLRQP
jgi:hypothetical protein